MHFQTQEILFFSFNSRTCEAFERYVRLNEKEYANMSEFRLIREQGYRDKAKTFRHIRDLFFFMDELALQRLANLILIIDPYSLLIEAEKDNKKLLKELIISYPEVKIVFLSVGDDWQQIFNKLELKCKIEPGCKDCSERKPCEVFIPHIHTFGFLNKRDKENNHGDMDFDMLIRGQSNLFDASNLRNLIKQDFFNEIKVRTNYPCTHCSRNNRFALVVEEELPQAYFNAYGMYINGFRAMPVVSNKELEILANGLLDKSKLEIIIRDYDLLFEDYGNSENLHKLRGIKRNGMWEPKTEFWEKIIDGRKELRIFFITRFDKSDDNRKPKVLLKFNWWQKLHKNRFNKFGFYIDSKKDKVWLRGLSKPINGLYELLSIPDINDAYLCINKEPGFDIGRDDADKDSHATPPFIYHISENLIKRSKKYYEERMYMLSALLAKEALEVLNGFHFMLMLKAIHLHAIAETSLIVGSMGIDERILAYNTQKRLNDIKAHVDRICFENPKARKNVLKQIFNDVRNIFNEKEFFKAGDMALNELVNVEQGSFLSFNRVKKQAAK